MAIDLKKVEKVNIVLTKRKVANATVRVGACFDVSGSMQDEYRDGIVQEAVNRLFAIAYRFDDNGELENWVFSNDAWQIGPVTNENLDDFVKREVMGAKIPGMWGGTNYSPALNLVGQYYSEANNEEWVDVSVTEVIQKKAKGLFGKVKSLFGKKQYEEVTVTTKVKSEKNAEEHVPGYLIVLTDGDCGDKLETIKSLEQLEKLPIYVQFVGLGNDSSFSFLKEMGERFSQVGFMHISNLRTITDDDLYEQLVNEEFITFLRTNHPNSITNS